MLTGTIERLVRDHGLGFIKAAGVIYLFFHLSEVRDASLDLLKEGQRVNFKASPVLPAAHQAKPKAVMIAAATQTVQNKKAPLIFSTWVRTNQGIAISSASRKANQVQAQTNLLITPDSLTSSKYVVDDQSDDHPGDSNPPAEGLGNYHDYPYHRGSY